MEGDNTNFEELKQKYLIDGKKNSYNDFERNQQKQKLKFAAGLILIGGLLTAGAVCYAHKGKKAESNADYNTVKPASVSVNTSYVDRRADNAYNMRNYMR